MTFCWRNLVCRFGIPHIIVTDNGTQFASQKVKDFCQSLKIMQLFASVEHPQTNGQAEAANKVVLDRLKKRLDKAKGSWVDHLCNVLWSYHMTP